MTHPKKKFYDERTLWEKLINPNNQSDVDLRSSFLEVALRGSSTDSFSYNEVNLLMGGYEEYLEAYVPE